MFSKFLSLHNCIMTCLYPILKGTIFSLFLFVILYRWFVIFDTHSPSCNLVCTETRLSKSDQRNGTKKKKKKTKRRKSCNYGGLAHYTHQANQLYVIGIPIEFFQRCTGTREEPDSSWIVSKTINTCSSTCVSVYVCVCVCFVLLYMFVKRVRYVYLILIISNIIIV